MSTDSFTQDTAAFGARQIPLRAVALLEQNGLPPERVAAVDEEIVQLQVRSAASERMSAPGIARRRGNPRGSKTLPVDMASSPTSRQPKTG